jgi:cell wall-associated NlpC family hydrolase
MISRVARGLALALVVVAPRGAAAQTTYTVGPFLSLNGSLPGNPVLAGVSLERAPGILGTRIGLGLDLADAATAADDGRLGNAWAADADLTVGLHRLPFLRAALTGWSPMLFAGLGVQGGGEADGSGALVPSAAYGVGTGYEFAGRMAAVAELRRRLPIELFGDADGGVRRGWDFRVALAVRIGGGSAAPPPVVAARPPARAAERQPLFTTANLPPGDEAAPVLDFADDYLGTPYLWGGDSPSRGFDCSGFVQYVYRRQGVGLPRTSRQQALVGRSVDTDALQPGDLLFFAGDYRTVDHVAMYVGDGHIIHSSESGGGVLVDDLASQRGRWFRQHLVGARRVIEDGRSLIDGSVPTGARPGQFDPPDRAPRRN